MRTTLSLAIVIVATALSAAARAADPEPLRPALTVRVIHPEHQCENLLGLFQNTRAPHPAAALAAWHRATGDPHGLGKGPEALITLLNPAMLPEWRLLDGASAVVGFDPADGRIRWSLTLPKDDGTFAALATAFALTGGGPEAPLPPASVDRLGPPGAPLMAIAHERIALAGSRDDLAAALGSSCAAPSADLASGYAIHLDPAALGSSGTLLQKRLAGALNAAGCTRLDGQAFLEGETARIRLTGQFPGAHTHISTIDPAWLDVIPADKVLAAFSTAIDPSPQSWDALFAWADRVERVDPARAQVAPLRTRLNLLTLPARVSLEADLWPKLKGLTTAVSVDAGNRVDGLLVALHASDDPAAARIVNRVLPALASAWKLRPDPQEVGEGTRCLGRIQGRALSAAQRGSTVLIAWGDLLAPSLAALNDPSHSAGPSLRSSCGEVRPHHLGAFWPCRSPVLAPDRSPLQAALASASLVLWRGTVEGTVSTDAIEWTGLRGGVQRFLDMLPMAAAD